jgi:hypothetical protein
MILRMMLFVSRCEAGRLGQQDKAQQQPYTRVPPCCAPSNCHSTYSIAPNSGPMFPDVNSGCLCDLEETVPDDRLPTGGSVTAIKSAAVFRATMVKRVVLAETVEQALTPRPLPRAPAFLRYDIYSAHDG